MPDEIIGSDDLNVLASEAKSLAENGGLTHAGVIELVRKSGKCQSLDAIRKWMDQTVIRYYLDHPNTTIVIPKIPSEMIRIVRPANDARAIEMQMGPIIRETFAWAQRRDGLPSLVDAVTNAEQYDTTPKPIVPSEWNSQEITNYLCANYSSADLWKLAEELGGISFTATLNSEAKTVTGLITSLIEAVRRFGLQKKLLEKIRTS